MARPPAMMSARPSPSRSAARASSQAMPPSSMVCRSKASGTDSGRGVEHEDARAARTDRAGLVWVALADDQFIVTVAVEVGGPDGVAPLHRLGDYPARQGVISSL